jgi:hypothetical protein
MKSQFDQAIAAIDNYNAGDPHLEDSKEGQVPKELLYARRMSEKLWDFAPDAPEYLRLAVHCQHIGRWEIPRDSYPMDRKGYLQWRNTLKFHHVKIASQILTECGYDASTIDKVSFLLLKKELHKNADTQLLEDVVCLVFIEYYLADFAAKHEPGKVVDILKKTMKKMSAKAIEAVGRLGLPADTEALIAQAAAV